MPLLLNIEKSFPALESPYKEFWYSVLNKRKVKIGAMALGGLTLAAVPAGVLVACGSSADEDFTKIRVVYENSWRPVMDAAIAKLTPAEQSSFVLVAIQDNTFDKNYFETLTTKPADAATADVFAAPVDRFSALVSSNILLDLGSYYDESLYTTNSIGTIAGKHYAYPLNTESIIQIFNRDTTGTGFNRDTGWDTFSNAFNDSKFITKWADLWYAAAYLSGAMVKSEAGVADAPALWLKQDDAGKWAAPILSNQDFETAAKLLYGRNQQLRDSTEAWKKTIANAQQRSERDVELRQHFVNKDIDSTIDGLHVINDLIARTILANSSGSTYNQDAIKTSLANIGTSKLPSLNSSQPARHFKGGWGYAINGLKLQKAGSQDAINAKIALENKFLKVLTSSELANAWFKAGGKISAAKNATAELTLDDVRELQLINPQSPDGAKISLASFNDDVLQSVLDLYESSKAAVKTQYDLNIEQPSGVAWNFWTYWDENGLSTEQSGSNAAARQAAFWNKFKTDIGNWINQNNS